MAYLDDAVLDGIQKRLDRLLDREVLRRRLEELLTAERPEDGIVEALRARLAETQRKIDRLVSALAAGTEDLPSVRLALVALEREREGREAELAETTARAAGMGDPEATVNALLESLSRSRDVLAAGDVEERRGLVRMFLRGIEIQKRARQAILSWYRLQTGDTVSLKLVAPRGFELNRLTHADYVDAEALPLPPPRRRR